MMNLRGDTIPDHKSQSSDKHFHRFVKLLKISNNHIGIVPFQIEIKFPMKV